MTTSLPVGAASGPALNASIDFSSMNPDDAMLLVQADRVRLCEAELNAQIKTIQAKNEQMRKLNQIQAVLAEIKSKFSDTKPDAEFIKIPGVSDWLNKQGGLDRMREAAAFWQEAGLDPSYGAKLSAPLWDKTDFRYKDLEVMSTAVKGSIDSLSSSTQMDMVRMQSLNNKRSEAFETMTNMMKKAQDNKSSIVGNMR